MSIVLKALLLLLVPAAGQVPTTPTELPATAATDASASLAKSAAEDEAEEAADAFGEKHDTDNDGKLSMKEALVAAVDAEAVKKAFTAADVNADTFLEPNELSKFLASVQGGANAPSFLQVEEQEQDEETEEDEEAEDDEEEDEDEDEDDEDDEEEVEVKKAVLADSDEDGVLTMQEVMDASGEDLAIVRNACETADVNDDRVIDADELPTLMKALQGGEALLQRVEQEDEEDEEEVEVKKAVLADADEDGKLSMQEVMDASGEDFAIVRKACETADVNDDQFIDADELPKLMKALM